MKNSILGLLLVTLTAANATAQVTSAFFPDYGLTDYVSNTWDVDTSGGEWLGAALRVELTGGSIYQDGTGDETPPPTSAVGDLRYDSYMTGGYDTDYVTPSPGATPIVIGNAYDIYGSMPGAAVFDQLIDAAWISEEDAAQVGSLMLGRVTLSADAQGYYSYQLEVSSNSPTTFVNGIIENGVMTQNVRTSRFAQNTNFAGHVSNTWRVATQGSEWLGSALRVELTVGTVYQNTGPGSGDVPPDPANFGANPDLRYDSYVTGGTDSAFPSTIGGTPIVIGNAYDIYGSTPGAAVLDSTEEIDTAWISMEDAAQVGSLMLGRVTLSDDAQGFYSYQLELDNDSTTTFVNGIIEDGVMTDNVITARFVQDTALAGHVSNTWQVATQGSEWLATALRVELTGGSIYQDGTGDETPPPTSAVGDLRYDSYMTGGYDTDYGTPSPGATPIVLGNAYDIDGSTPGAAVFELNDQLIDAAWMSEEDAAQVGNLMLGRVTLSDDAQGTFKFRVVLDGSNDFLWLNGVIVNGEMLLSTGSLTLPVPGDADGDGDVDAADAEILAAYWQQTAIDGGASVGDFNGDRDVNDIDATIMAANWGVGTAAAVPEPSVAFGLLILALAALAAVNRRRQRR